jgi:hypothetical protein
MKEDRVLGEMGEPREARHNVSDAVLLLQYGLGEPLDWGEDCDIELKLQNDLWNRLVEIEHAHQDTFRALTADDPQVVVLKADEAVLEEKLTALLAQRKLLRAAARKRIPTRELNAEIADVKTQLKEARSLRQGAERAARGRVKDRIEVLNKKWFEDVKQARNASGLHWGNYNAICVSYERARAAMLKKRAAHANAQLRFHRFDGSGRITNQIQGGMTVEELFADSRSQVAIEPLQENFHDLKLRSERRRASRSVLTVSVHRRNGVRRTVRFPIFVHRPFPPDAVIKEVVVHRRKLADAVRWTATFLCRFTVRAQPPESRDPDGDVVAVDLGWRRLDSGMRVATVMRNDETRFVTLTERLMEEFERIEALRSERDDLHAAILPELRQINWSTAPPKLTEIAAWWRALPKPLPRHTARLALSWRDCIDWTPLPSQGSPHEREQERRRRRLLHWEPQLFERADEWRRGDKRLWQREAHWRNQAALQRRELYRIEARKIVAGARVVILEQFDLAKAARLSDDNPLHAAARRNRVIAAVSELRQWIRNQAAKTGVAIVEHQGVSTWICSNSSQRFVPADPAKLVQTCPCCSRGFDQDVEACRNMLAAYGASGAVAAE